MVHLDTWFPPPPLFCLQVERMNRRKKKSWSQNFDILILNITGQMDAGTYFHTPWVNFLIPKCGQIHWNKSG